MIYGNSVPNMRLAVSPIGNNDLLNKIIKPNMERESFQSKTTPWIICEVSPGVLTLWGCKKPPPSTSFSSVISNNVGNSPETFPTFSFDPFAKLV